MRSHHGGRLLRRHHNSGLLARNLQRTLKKQAEPLMLPRYASRRGYDTNDLYDYKVWHMRAQFVCVVK